MQAERDTFVVAAGTWRLLLVPLLLIGALAFFPLAAVLLFIDVDSLLVRLLLWLFAIVLLGIGISILLISLSLLTRIEVGKDRLKVRVPRWRGPLAWLPWIRAEIPYRDIKKVERRDEFYRSFGLPSMQTAYSIETADGRRIVLGYTSPVAAWNYPLEDAARLIAERAGVTLVDRGGVKMGGIVRNVLNGPPSWDAPRMSEDERRATHASAVRAFSLVLALMAALIALRACFLSQ